MWSPDSSKIVFTADSRLFLVDVESGDSDEIAYNSEGGYNLSSFSANGGWLVYSRSNRDLNSEVYLFNIADREEINVTQHRFSEFGGAISDDGSHVIFVSDRNGTRHLYAVSLSKRTHDPDDPLAKKPKAAQRKDDGKSEQANDTDEGDQAADDQPIGVDSIEIDLDGIDRRPWQLSTGGDAVSNAMLIDGGRKALYTQGGALWSVDLDGENRRKIADGSFRSLELTADGKYLFYSSGGQVNRMTVSGGGKKAINFRFRVKVDEKAQWEQVFEEAWRVMKYRFYDKNMHGTDWDAAKAKYKPMLQYVGENQDLYDLCNEMIGELNASHTGVSGPGTRSMPRLYSTSDLGIDLRGDGTYYRVSHIDRNGPADREWLDINVGDYVLAINGADIRDGDNYYRNLTDLLNEYVNLKVASPKQGADEDVEVFGEPRVVRVRAGGSMRNIRYTNWVDRNRELVDKWSGGKIGYVHIRSMNQTSLRQFETEINQFWNKNGMIIDIRYNGGGNIDQQIIDILERKPYEYWNFRQGGRAAGRRPRQAIAGPQVMLINWRSASDSEVTPQAFRDLELGRIVGNPTYGAVIATGSYRLLNGGSIRTPGSLVVTYDPSKEHNYGTNLENYGVPPDVWVENSPQDELDGFDRELKTAVDEALRMLAQGNWQFGEDD